MEDIIAQARDLGKKIAAHPRTAVFLAAARAVADDREAQTVLHAYQEQVAKIHDLEARGKPIEVDDKRKLSDAQSQVAGNDKLKQMMKGQADYMELMNRVNQAIDAAIEEHEPVAAG